MSKNVLGWGDWHTSSVIDQTCPQGCGKHSVEQADDLNQATSVRRKAGLRVAHERWLRDDKKGQANGSSQDSRDAGQKRQSQVRVR